MVANAGTAPDLSNYYDAGAVDTLLLGRAPASHEHTQYVTDAALGTLLAQKVDYQSMSAYVSGGFEQIDSNIIRHVSTTSEYHTLRYYSGGQNVDFELPTRAHFDTIKTMCLQNAVNIATHIGG